LEKELCRLANCSEFEESLRSLGLISESIQQFDIRRDDAWTRGGAETYIYRFWITQPEDTEKGYILKACVPFSAYTGIDNILNEWVNRRRLLSDNRVSTPELFVYGSGEILEELIPYQLEELFTDSKTSNLQRKNLLIELARFGGILAKLGFVPVSPFQDLRSRGNDVVAIDFGQDLGPSGEVNVGRSNIWKALQQITDRWRVNLQSTEIALIKNIFEDSCGISPIY
jgi:hypothetical protein